VVKETVVVKEEVPAESGEITIEYWQYFYDARVDAMNRLIQQFEQENPGIHVVHTNFPYADYRDKIAASVPAGVGPDVATLYYGWLPLWVDSGYLVPLPQDEFPTSMIESEFSPLVQAGKFQGKYWAIPTAVRTLSLFWNKDLFIAAGLDPETDESKVLLYQGIFKRIGQRHHLDYYWLWTPENWTWAGEESIQELPKAEKDILSALKALENKGSPFSLATCGWVLGPASDRAYFDKILPKDIPFSCINRNVGFAPVEKGFQKVSGRDKWQISWIEDDPALISPQLWAGRVGKVQGDPRIMGGTA